MKIDRNGILFLVAGFMASTGTSLAAEEVKLLPPEQGVYHGTFPDTPDEPRFGHVTQLVGEFESLVRKDVAIVTVGNHWFDGIVFPERQVQEVLSLGKVPLVYVLPWSSRSREAGEDRRYSLRNILAGQFDSEIRAYARTVKDLRSPLMISFASEANGNWYPWSGAFAGADQFSYGDPLLADGPERYQDAYRRFVDLFRAEQVTNVTWVFHVTGANKPNERWNQVQNYYPGDGYVDWVATSIYSAQEPGDEWEDFEIAMQQIYPDLESLSPDKPIMILEFATIEDRFNGFRKADWITNAMTVLTSGRYPRVKGMTYWHESSWHPSGLYNLRLDSSAEALQAYSMEINRDVFVSGPIFSGPLPLEPCNCGYRRNSTGQQACTIWRGDTILEERLFSSCTQSVCEQLFSPSTIAACSGDIRSVN